MKKLRVLIACEESQAVCKAFRNLGHFAYSCDLQDCSGGHPEWHLKMDVRPLLLDDWDLIIAHPPCTYMSRAGATSMYPQPGVIDKERYKKALAARDFFMLFYNCKCPHVAIENPVPLRCVDLPSCDQIINPFEFGEPYSKKTLLWLKNLPFLIPTGYKKDYVSWVAVKSGSRNRSKTFPGIANAMAEQWSNYLISL